MNEIEILSSMLALQQRLNDDTNGIGWEKGFTKEGKVINFRRCIYMECAELIDSFAWKHWKNISAPTNWANVRIEIVDIWHFIMSLILEQNLGVGSLVNCDKDFKKMSQEITAIMEFKEFCKEENKPSENCVFDIINDIEFIIHKCSIASVNLGELLNAYFKMCVKCGLNLTSLYKIYIGKNVLNAFRQAHGYKEAKYKKIWNNKEDNEVLSEILEQNKALSYDEIYAKLEQIYKAL